MPPRTFSTFFWSTFTVVGERFFNASEAARASGAAGGRTSYLPSRSRSTSKRGSISAPSQSRR